ncbi:2-keto-4-pentenoate hydratase [Mycolicibacterium sp.]|uniref:2-keto-4-pentenoate hydratase n=1 Tax=Mycolicibacterium sp. TaxID=2320850 RepID=UPI000961B981|nr:2-keto-4-pentenoate hydratase [Mycobacterium sp. SWH-M3]
MTGTELAVAHAAIRDAADRLRTASRTGVPCAPVRDLLGEKGIEAAYSVQRMLVAERVAGGARLVGAKIGLTAPAVQQQFGVFEPDFGALLDDMVFCHRQPVSISRFLQPRAEGEIAFVLGRDIDNPGATVADVLLATEFVLPAIEIVDSRIVGWDLTIADTVADNASAGAVVLGTTAHRLVGLDLSRIGMVLERDGEPVAHGAGHACLGSPVAAVTWLAREMYRRGSPLRAGDTIMSGALGPMVAVDAPGRFRMCLDALGDVEATIERD